ncbi:MAG TPA: methyltransferase [Thermoplasmata archaeon]|nr:methyltransferase [Thermoplasmata archaeon]
MADDELPLSEQYFAEHPHARSARAERRFLYRGELLTFVVDTGTFSSHGLDPGTSLLIENLVVRPSDRVLDLGCGWGAVGVAAAKAATEGEVVLTDVNRRASRLARENLERNRVRNAQVRVGSLFDPVVDEKFDLIATNPPFHAGRELVLRLLSEAPNHLRPEGRLVVVGKGSQGIRFYQEWLEAHWPGTVTVLGRGSGYRVVEARLEPNGRSSDAPATRAARRQSVGGRSR